MWSLGRNELKLEQLERLRSEDTPRRLMITLTIESFWIQSQKKTKLKLQIWRICQNFEFFEFWNKHYTRHTFWSCSIRCANMKWIRRVLLKIQSRHDSVHRRTDGQGETSIPPFQLHWSGGYNNYHCIVSICMVNRYAVTELCEHQCSNGFLPAVRCQAMTWTNTEVL